MNRDRITYWQTQMDAAHDFMMQVMDYPVQESHEPLVDLRAADDDAHVEVTFSETKLAGRFDRIFFLRQGLIDNFTAAARAFNDRGWIIHLEDGYRTLAMQRHLSLDPRVFDAVLQRTIWELNGQQPSPELLFRRLTVLVATYPKIGTHTSGSAVDISVLDRTTHTPIDRGGPYLEMSELTPMTSPFPSETAQQNRREITTLMAQHGFVAYPYEFWHYNANDAYHHLLARTNQPAPYGSINLTDQTGPIRNVQPVPNPNDPLHTPDQIRTAIQQALTRTKEP